MSVIQQTNRTLHVFNPSHDESLAANSPFYYPTTIARRLQKEWGTLPALWAEEGDCVWIPEDGEVVMGDAEWCKGVEFVTKRQMARPSFWTGVGRIDPWGWDPVVVHQLRRLGAPDRLLPSANELADIRMLSSRHTTARLLPALRQALDEVEHTWFSTVGTSVVARDIDEVTTLARKWGGAMVKSLWSCSGRGVFRFGAEPSANDLGRVRRLIGEQGGVEVEPVYEATADFALEFQAHADGSVSCIGLSLFATNASGAYTGNLVAPQEELERRLRQLCGPTAEVLTDLKRTCERQLELLLGGRYVGPLGIDMMQTFRRIASLYDDECEERSYHLHPCIEVNLRRTMGHVALKVAQRKLKPESLPEFFQNICYFCPS